MPFRVLIHPNEEVLMKNIVKVLALSLSFVFVFSVVQAKHHETVYKGKIANGKVPYDFKKGDHIELSIHTKELVLKPMNEKKQMQKLSHDLIRGTVVQNNGVWLYWYTTKKDLKSTYFAMPQAKAMEFDKKLKEALQNYVSGIDEDALEKMRELQEANRKKALEQAK